MCTDFGILIVGVAKNASKAVIDGICINIHAKAQNKTRIFFEEEFYV